MFEFAGRQGEKSRNKLSGNSATKTSDWSRYATDEMDAGIQRDIANPCGTFFCYIFLLAAGRLRLSLLERRKKVLEACENWSMPSFPRDKENDLTEDRDSYED